MPAHQTTRFRTSGSHERHGGQSSAPDRTSAAVKTTRHHRWLVSLFECSTCNMSLQSAHGWLLKARSDSPQQTCKALQLHLWQVRRALFCDKFDFSNNKTVRRLPAATNICIYFVCKHSYVKSIHTCHICVHKCSVRVATAANLSEVSQLQQRQAVLLLETDFLTLKRLPFFFSLSNSCKSRVIAAKSTLAAADLCLQRKTCTLHRHIFAVQALENSQRPPASSYVDIPRRCMTARLICTHPRDVTTLNDDSPTFT